MQNIHKKEISFNFTNYSKNQNFVYLIERKLLLIILLYTFMKVSSTTYNIINSRTDGELYTNIFYQNTTLITLQIKNLFNNSF